MDVIEFLKIFAFRAHVEIVEPSLPESGRSLRVRQVQRVGLSIPNPAPSGNALLEDLHDQRRCSDPWLTYQQMKMLWHDDIASHDKTVFPANLLQDFEEQVTTPRRSKKRLPFVTTTGDEMPVTLAVDADQSFGHDGILYPTLSQKLKNQLPAFCERMGHPRVW